MNAGKIKIKALKEELFDSFFANKFIKEFDK